jgi:hypothetical protein
MVVFEWNNKWKKHLKIEWLAKILALSNASMGELHKRGK